MNAAPAATNTAPPAMNAVPFARDLASFGDRVALVTPDGKLSYADLADRVAGWGRAFGPHRRLVMLSAANTVDAISAYLAALAFGHVVLLTAPCDTLLESTYDPDVVVRDGVLHERRSGSAHTLHPDLALLLSTSGSTGSAKLVRLSHDNLQANAASIVEYLGIGPGDRAATVLPMQYCYGLSVINSHLLRGASLLLTEKSVTDPTFWEDLRACEATSFAGVPHTFELLDRIGFDRLRLPRLRYVTQAGGRLAPDRVRHYARLGKRAGWRFFVMYGQTEATARIAYLPPELAEDHPSCAGVPIPGGSLRLRPVPGWSDQDTGELVYSGPNVMLGYATTAADLCLGRTVTELLTGDIARRTADGLYEIVGRRHRFAKIFGLRIDLAHIESALAEQHISAVCADNDGWLSVVAEVDEAQGQRVRRIAARASRLPSHAVRAHCVPSLPRKPTGKPDYAAALELARSSCPPPNQAKDTTNLVALFATVLDRPEATGEDTFASLGGDSLSYVEMSIRLEQALAHLPTGWHTTPIRQLRPAPTRRRVPTLDTSVALRAASILLVVGTHVSLFALSGGAHLLLAVAGFNFARFHLGAAARLERIRTMGRGIGKVALISIAWITFAAALLSNAYGLPEVLLLHNVLNSRTFNDFWFIEALVYVLLGVTALLAIPAVDRFERRHPFQLPILVLAAGLVSRYQLIPGVKLATPLFVIWLFALGWAAAKATSTSHRVLVSIAAAATIPGAHGNLPREVVMLGGLILLVWIPALPSLTVLNRTAGVLASASLYIYLTHWQVFPRLEGFSPLVRFAACIAAGVAIAWVVKEVSRQTRRALARRRKPVSPADHALIRLEPD
jgi:acyl-CoA synthetase (AMP-forming)/AMP-acid ligase II